MKKFLSVLSIITILSLFLGINVNAKVISAEEVTEIEYLENGDYLETVISDVPAIDTGYFPDATTKTITKSKTTKYKNSSGTTLWYIKITATFNYNGSTSKCKSCSHKASAPASDWSIKKSSSSKSGNSATATATAKYLSSTGVYEYTRSVKIKCSANGTVS